jgi:hypothetical protein
MNGEKITNSDLEAIKKEQIQTGKYFEDESRSNLEEKLEQRRENIIYYLLLAFYACIVLFVISLLLEFWSSYVIAESIASKEERIARTSKDIQRKIKPPSNLKRYFPNNIPGYHLKGRKDIPEDKILKAEAVYEPEDMDLQLRSPIVIYCQVAYFKDLREAEIFIQEKLKNFPKNQQAVLLGNTYANTGCTKDESAYFLGTINNGLVFWFKTSYVEIVPKEPNRLSILKYHNEKIATEILKAVEQVDSGIDDIDIN